MTDRYDTAAQILHWLIAAAVIGLVLAGLTLRYDLVPKPTARTLSLLHIGTGLTVFVLMALRLGLRILRPPPALPTPIPPAEQVLAKTGHALFYVLLFAMPVFGVLFVQSEGHAVSWFGLVTLPPILGKSEAVKHLFEFLHFWGGIAVIGLLALHVAAVFHHQRRGTPVLRRMLPGRSAG
jgi:cytochrome b561